MTAELGVKPRAVVLYDGRCPLCRKSVAVLRRLDWLGRLDYRDANDVGNLPESAAPLDPQRLLQEMHVVTPDRRRAHAGFAAFRWMAGRLPPLWPVWPLLFVPGVPWLGRRLYRRVARYRYHLAPCHEGECTIPPRRTPSA